MFALNSSSQCEQQAWGPLLRVLTKYATCDISIGPITVCYIRVSSPQSHIESMFACIWSSQREAQEWGQVSPHTPSTLLAFDTYWSDYLCNIRVSGLPSFSVFMSAPPCSHIYSTDLPRPTWPTMQTAEFFFGRDHDRKK
jgi:hypothetical protein